ncbi:hypothetical protein DM01DRAFT_1334539 [Hesseltinella vesiculosa]|uniref:Integrase catalytic domain-containing protein n=1 Tax=Hesseltinella vesiculosa TaxID=101127 RepID=A0A1X2GMH5_9FUNG|nr:hypothetical protein DM01DRAFT_1334539 [Hesseltinella vesiculosa]
MCKITGIDHRLVAPYHPRANGAAERTVQTTSAQYEINNKQVRLHNSTPFQLMFARAINDFKDYTKVKMNAHTHRAARKREEVINDLTEIVLPAIIKRTEQIRSAAQDKFNKKKNLVN